MGQNHGAYHVRQVTVTSRSVPQPIERISSTEATSEHLLEDRPFLQREFFRHEDGGIFVTVFRDAESR